MTNFLTVTGTASTENGTNLLGSVDFDRMVIVAVDDSNWTVECAATRRVGRGGRAKAPTVPFRLCAGQDLYAFATLVTGSSATSWEVGITWWDADDE